MSGPMSKVMNKTMTGVGDSSSENVADNEKDWPWWILTLKRILLSQGMQGKD